MFCGHVIRSVCHAGLEINFLLGSTGAPNFKKLGAPQMFYEHPLNIKEQHNRQLSGRAGNILPDD